MANMTTGVGISGLIVLTVLPVDGEEPLRVAVTPIHSFAPATVTIRAEDRAERRNRMLAIVADGDDFYLSGEYQISAVLADGAGRQRAYRSPVGERHRNLEFT